MLPGGKKASERNIIWNINRNIQRDEFWIIQYLTEKNEHDNVITEDTSKTLYYESFNYFNTFWDNTFSKTKNSKFKYLIPFFQVDELLPLRRRCLRIKLLWLPVTKNFTKKIIKYQPDHLAILQAKKSRHILLHKGRSFLKSILSNWRKTMKEIKLLAEFFFSYLKAIYLKLFPGNFGNTKRIFI